METEVRDFLIANHAGIFADRWLIRDLYQRQNFAKPTMILAPTDNALKNLLRETNKSWTDFLKLPVGTDILKNHLIFQPTRREWPMITSINARPYGSKQEDIEALVPGASLVVRIPEVKSPLVVLIINKVLVHPDQLMTLEARLPRGDEISRMGKDLFMKMVIDEKIAGRDLVALCNTSHEIGLLCDRDDQLLFKRLLKNEFNFNYDQGFAAERPRELYGKFHHFRIETYVRDYRLSHQDHSASSNYSLIKENPLPKSTFLGVPPKPKLLNNLQLVSEVVHLPLEGWFAENAVKPDDPPGQMSMGIVTEHTYDKKRAPVYLIYVKGKPETVTVFRRKMHRQDWGDVEISYEPSNEWLFNYFGNKHLAITDPKFKGVIAIKDLVQTFMKMQPIGYWVNVDTYDRSDIVIAVRLGNNEITEL